MYVRLSGLCRSSAYFRNVPGMDVWDGSYRPQLAAWKEKRPAGVFVLNHISSLNYALEPAPNVLNGVSLYYREQPT
jgi:hypothetical protein